MRLALFALLAALVFAAAAISCGRSGRAPVYQGGPSGKPASAQPETPGDSSAIQRNTLFVVSPDFSALSFGDEFDVKIDFELAEEMYQMSGRLIYDRRFVQPVRATRGAIPDSAVFFAKIDHPDFVPFAFTQTGGARGIPAGKGEILSVMFRVIADPAGAPRVRLLNDAQYLHLRNGKRERLAFDLEHRTVAQ